MPSRDALVRVERGDVLPSSRILPAVGLSTPVRRLITVVLPAPFGPIRAWRAPGSTAIDDVVGRGDAAEALQIDGFQDRHGSSGEGRNLPPPCPSPRGRRSALR